MTKVAQITGEGGRGGVRGGRGKLSGAGGRKAGMENDGTPVARVLANPTNPTTHTTRCCLFLRESDSEPWRGGGRGGCNELEGFFFLAAIAESTVNLDVRGSSFFKACRSDRAFPINTNSLFFF